jgi:chaperone modulatory protein CbpM
MRDETITGIVLDEQCTFTLAQLCRACAVSADTIIELVDQGVIEPSGSDCRHWRFRATSLYRVRTSLHLIRDLGVNPAGAALAMELLDEIETLRRQLRRMAE